MKKILLSLLLVAATSANAQTALNLKKSFEGNSFRFVPKMFAYEEKMQIVHKTESSYDIYDANLQKVYSIDNNNDLSQNVESIQFYDWDQNSYYSDKSFVFTQTLFNDDEIYEYVTKHYSSESDEYGSTHVDGFNIVSDDGTILQTIMLDKKIYSIDVDVWKIGGKIYLVVHNYNFCNFYEIEKGAATAVRQVESLPASPDNSIYNLNGQKMKNVTTNGVYIQNGQKKVVKK